MTEEIGIIDRIKVLLEEYKQIEKLWEFNRGVGLRRFQMNSLLNSGLITSAFTIAAQPFIETIRGYFVLSMMIIGILLSIIWFMSCLRHHKYIYLKLRQGAVIEQRLNNIIDEEVLMMFQQTCELFYPKKCEKGSTTVDGEKICISWLQRYSSSKVACVIPVIFIGVWAVFAIAFS
jgi:hypothetical protein